jgi:hypothetical protein
VFSRYIQETSGWRDWVQLVIFVCIQHRFKICAEPLHEMLEDSIQDGQAAKVIRGGHV